MGTQVFGSKDVYPTKPRAADLIQTPVQNTWYELLPAVSGRGILSRISAMVDTESLISIQIKVTIDGVENTLLSTGGMNNIARPIAARIYNAFTWPFDWFGSVNFYSSLKIEVRNITNTDNIHASADYSIE